ncbi:MAG: hypothetical protein ACTHJT_07180 [Cytophaga sp.]|uniref:hypothetical protein n=1 Tax=Cytophaga sp. TaxID=29535 RepID=UPI003F81362A
MKNNITLSIQHNNARRFEYFLKSINVNLTPAPFEWRSWKRSDLIQDACRFVSADPSAPLTISLIFCDSYHDANAVGTANGLSSVPMAKWSVNGDVLYLIESKNADQLSAILSTFAGEE